jgi:hypothetical protein
MKNNSKIIIICIFSLLCAYSKAVEFTEDKIQSLLNKAIETTENRSFVAEEKLSNKIKFEKELLYHKNIDGFNCLRRDVYLKNKVVASRISNKNGDYLVIPGKNILAKLEMPKYAKVNPELSKHFFTVIKSLKEKIYKCSFSIKTVKKSQREVYSKYFISKKNR